MRYLFLLLVFLGGGNWSEIKEPDLNVEFTLKKGDTAKIKKTDLKIKITGCGREALAGNNGEIPYCDAEIEDGANRKTVRLRSKEILPKYIITVEKINVTANSKAQDTSSENSCTLTVRRKKIITL